MNIIFHTLTGTAVAGIVATTLTRWPNNKAYLKACLAVFILTVLAHGLLDHLPHQYPFKARFDIGMSLAFFTLVAALSRPRFVLLFTVAFFGSVFPDLIDLGPQMVNQFLGTSLPTAAHKVFPWHRPEYSGSIFTHTLNQLSNFLHLLVVFMTTAMIIATHRAYSRWGGNRVVL